MKYKSLDNMAKRSLLEERRAGLEQQHFGLATQIEILQEQDYGDDEAATKERDQAVLDMQKQADRLKNLVDSYNTRIADLSDDIVQAAAKKPDEQ